VPETLVLLHGFGGTRHVWDRMTARLSPQRYLPLALDLPGHGEGVKELSPITFAGCVAQVLAQSPQRFALCGYSLGGRVALNLALAAPAQVSRLVLVSSTAGIKDPDERARRRDSDARLATELDNAPFEDFIEQWRSQPLFADEPPEVDELARAEQRRNDPAMLAAALRGIGTGEMEPLWSRLEDLRMPVAVVAGERDAKFRALGLRMTELLPRGDLFVLPGGHNLPLESPEALAHLLDR
jgi:2-succinyl-6-hydroxy-2,4-cyclohexadiene-1-carboxylate synthase